VLFDLYDRSRAAAEQVVWSRRKQTGEGGMRFSASRRLSAQAAKSRPYVAKPAFAWQSDVPVEVRKAPRCCTTCTSAGRTVTA